MTAVDAQSRTALQIACLYNKVDVVKYLTQEVTELVTSFNVKDAVNYSTDEHGKSSIYFSFFYLTLHLMPSIET